MGLPMELTWPAVWARRLERHCLTTPAVDAMPAAVVAAIGAAHAQIFTAAELSIGVRRANGQPSDVRDALWVEHSLVKTYGPRGTVHLLAMRDLPLWIGALSLLPPSGSLPRDVQLSAAQTEEILAAIAEALADAELTIDELTAAIVARCGPWAGERVMPAFAGMWPRWRQAMAIAAARGVLCFGPNRGRNVSYTNPQRWLPDFAALDGHVALAELLKRYLYAYGPATPGQFAQWLAIPPRVAAELFQALGEQLEPIEIAGSRAWVGAGDTAFAGEQPQGVRLLPYFDAYIVGCHPRERLFPGAAAQRALAGGQAGNFPVMLIDGLVGGVWHQRRSGKTVAITVEPLMPLTASQRRELDAQVEQLGILVGGTPQLTIGPVTAGPHA